MKRSMFAAAASLLALASCGGGGSGNPPNAPAANPATTSSPVPNPQSSPPASKPPPPTPSTSPSPTSVPTVQLGAVVLNPASLSFNGTSSSQPAVGAATVAASQAGWTGSNGGQITVTEGTPPCHFNGTGTSQIVSIAPASGTTFSVTPQNAGTCTLIFTGGGSMNAALAITVTTTSVIIQ